MSFKVPVISKYEWQRAAKSILSSPPAITPLKGDRYIVGNNPSGIWSNQQNKIAEYNISDWEFTNPFPGMMIYISSKNKLYKYTDSWNDAIVAGKDVIINESIGRQLTIDDFNLTVRCDSSYDQIFILPDTSLACIGGWYRFIKAGAGSLTIQAGESDQIADSGIGDTIYCDIPEQVYSTLTLLCPSVGIWVLTGGHGTWTTTQSV